MNPKSLFINTLAFEFPSEPKTFYFSKDPLLMYDNAKDRV